MLVRTQYSVYHSVQCGSHIICKCLNFSKLARCLGTILTHTWKIHLTALTFSGAILSRSCPFLAPSYSAFYLPAVNCTTCTSKFFCLIVVNFWLDHVVHGGHYLKLFSLADPNPRHPQTLVPQSGIHTEVSHFKFSLIFEYSVGSSFYMFVYMYMYM